MAPGGGAPQDRGGGRVRWPEPQRPWLQGRDEAKGGRRGWELDSQVEEPPPPAPEPEAAAADPDEAAAGSPVVFTNKARCRDCYRCLRVCPVKAIRLHEGQAEVVGERCIACGACIRACPQQARVCRSDLPAVRELLRGPEPVAASVAPGFVAAFPAQLARRLPSALRLLGFARVEETAVAAWHVAQASRRAFEESDGPTVCTACPAAVRWVERYRPDAASWLAPVPSPAELHARSLRSQGARVVFIGPCVAKKLEADRSTALDCALTFSELLTWLDEAGLALERLEESGFDATPGDRARLFPLPGGLIRTAGLSTEPGACQALACAGVAELSDALAELRQQPRPLLVEPLLCPRGCISGPGMPEQAAGLLGGALAVSALAAEPHDPAPQPPRPELLAFQPAPSPPPPDAFGEDEIRQVLESSGKGDPADRLDCGACGYESCREKAVAVLRGLAELEMCLPRMRRLAERRTDRIIESSPNGILILDERLQVLSMNPAFRSMFRAGDALCGHPVSRLMDPEPFEAAAAAAGAIVERTVRHERFGVVCHQLLYRLDQDRQLVGIFVNVTASRARKEALEHLRSETIAQANELMEHQLSMAQQMARLLGDATAQGESLVHKLLRLAGEEAQTES